jgi:hypothetical protein
MKISNLIKVNVNICTTILNKTNKFLYNYKNIKISLITLQEDTALNLFIKHQYGLNNLLSNKIISNLMTNRKLSKINYNQLNLILIKSKHSINASIWINFVWSKACLELVKLN